MTTPLAQVPPAAPLASIALRLALLCLSGTAAVIVLPRLGNRSAPMPDSLTLLGVGLALICFTAALFMVGMTRATRLSSRIWTYALAYNALIIGVKFVLGPISFYANNGSVSLTSLGFLGGGLPTAVIVGSAVLVPYLAVYVGLYLFYRRRLWALFDRPRARNLVLRVVVLALLLFPASVVTFYVLGLGGLEYMVFVLSTPIALLVAVMLAVAVHFGRAAFRSAVEEAAALRDATMLATLFWIGLSLLLVYHALWVVYFFVLISLWPLKVVAPK